MITAAACHAAWRALPVVSLDTIIGPGTCVVLAPHPDDESLGCGGLIATCCAAGRPPQVAILTDGSGSHPNSLTCPPERMRLIRQREAHIAATLLGLPAERLLFCNFPDTKAPRTGPGFAAAVRTLRSLCEREPGCTAILAPWRHDPHGDHEAASLIAAAVAAECGIRHIAYPVWGWMLPPDRAVPDPAPSGWRLDITPVLPAKRRAIEAHKSQFGEVVTDDPSAFHLPPALVAALCTPFETFLTT
ncbi:MAG: PIG-L deacetylase family protein [Acetobacteraceae bacterium]